MYGQKRVLLLLVFSIILIAFLTGDNYFQLSKQWHRLEQFRKQFETDHDIDSRLRLEIENDLTEEVDGEMEGLEFDLGEF